MNSGEIFREIFDQFSSDDIFGDWRQISKNCKFPGEKEKIHRIIVRISCYNADMYAAGKEVELLNPALSGSFPKFLLKFVNTFQNRLPSEYQTPLNTRLLLKFIDLLSENPKNAMDFMNFSDFLHISQLFDLAGNVIIKDLLEKAANLYPDDGKFREIGARDLLDGVLLSEEAQDEKYQEEPFLNMKMKLMNLPTTSNASSSSSFERKYLQWEMSENPSKMD